MRQEDKTSITVSKETRRELKSLLLQVQAERDESLSQDDLLKLLMDYYKSRNWGRYDKRTNAPYSIRARTQEVGGRYDTRTRNFKNLKTWI